MESGPGRDADAVKQKGSKAEREPMPGPKPLAAARLSLLGSLALYAAAFAVGRVDPGLGLAAGLFAIVAMAASAAACVLFQLAGLFDAVRRARGKRLETGPGPGLARGSSRP